MAVPVDFTTVSAQGLETSEHPEALAGLRANEARYFHNKFKHTFEAVSYTHLTLPTKRIV